MRGPAWKPTPFLASVAVFGGLGLILCTNRALGERWIRAVPYVTLVLAPLPTWGALWVLALIMDRVLDVVLDLVLPSSTKER